MFVFFNNIKTFDRVSKPFFLNFCAENMKDLISGKINKNNHVKHDEHKQIKRVFSYYKAIVLFVRNRIYTKIGRAHV